MGGARGRNGLSTTKARARGVTLSERKSADAPAKRSLGHDIREFVETVVFVLVLVSLLRMFGCEAFVIPTGSMATTLLGAHKSATCPECGYVSTVGASDEVERGIRVERGFCQNCRRELDVAAQKPASGDRVLVSKFLYEGFTDPQRWEVIVFKWTGQDGFPANFIKRMIGAPGETIGIHGGDIFLDTGSTEDDRFAIARKPPDVMMATRRLVHDNDLPAKDLEAAGAPPHWLAEQGSGWTAEENGRLFSTKGEKAGAVVFRQIVRPEPSRARSADATIEPRLVTDFEAYNSAGPLGPVGLNWVGDLMLDCRVTFDRPAGSFYAELGEGDRRYRCVLDLSGNKIVLTQNGTPLTEKEWDFTRVGSLDLRWANFDDRLTLWLDGSLVFGAGLPVEPLAAAEAGPLDADLRPVLFGSDGASATVSALRVYRDLYYTQTTDHADATSFDPGRRPMAEYLADIRQQLVNKPMKLFPVPDDSYFMLGDNSPASSDGRMWRGERYVTRRLILGRALVLYWPIWNWKFVR